MHSIFYPNNKHRPYTYYECTVNQILCEINKLTAPWVYLMIFSVGQIALTWFHTQCKLVIQWQRRGTFDGKKKQTYAEQHGRAPSRFMPQQLSIRIAVCSPCDDASYCGQRQIYPCSSSFGAQRTSICYCFRQCCLILTMLLLSVSLLCKYCEYEYYLFVRYSFHSADGKELLLMLLLQHWKIPCGIILTFSII